MGKSDADKTEKRSTWGRIVDALCTVFSLRLALTIIYFVLIVLLCVTQNISIFQSPKIRILNIEASRVVGARVRGFATWYGVDVPIEGANATAQIDIKMWVTTLNIDIEIPYGYLPQNISQQYHVQDVPCAEFRGFIKNMQIFSLLSIFSGFILLVLTVSNFFTRMFLPLLWLFLWITVAFSATMVAMMFRLLCDGACYGQVDQIPPFTNLAMPMGGFALAIICLETYLVTSLMTVFL